MTATEAAPTRSGYVATFERRDHSTTAPAIRHRDEPLRELRDVLDLEREFAEWITGETIEPGGDHHETGREVTRRIGDRSLQGIHVHLGREAAVAWARSTPNDAARDPTPRPVPGYQGDWCIDTKRMRRIVLDERLRAVAVVHVPVDDQHALDAFALARVVRADGDVAEEAESHPAVSERVVTGRSDGAERARAYRRPPVHGVEHAANGGACGVARSFADERVRVEAATARQRQTR